MSSLSQVETEQVVPEVGCPYAPVENPVLPVRDPELAKAMTDEATRQSQTIELIASREPQSIQAESYRSIRTTLRGCCSNASMT